MDNRIIREEYAEIAQEIIDQEEILTDIANSQATIVYLGSNNAKVSKGKKILGECEKVSEKYKWGIPADFTITVFEPNVAGFTDEQLRILLFHELLHVGIEFLDDGSERYSIKPHDYEDFKIITDRYGTEWGYTNNED